MRCLLFRPNSGRGDTAVLARYSLPLCIESEHISFFQEIIVHVKSELALAESEVKEERLKSAGKSSIKGDNCSLSVSSLISGARSVTWPLHEGETES